MVVSTPAAMRVCQRMLGEELEGDAKLASEITESRNTRRLVTARGTELAWGEPPFITNCIHLTPAGGTATPAKWRPLLPPSASEDLGDHLSVLCTSAMHPRLAATEP